MLPTIKMVNAVESLYDGKCTVTEYQKVKKPNGSIGMSEVVVLENQPCRMSYRSVKPNESANVASVTSQSVVVYLSPTVEVKPGSKLTITQNGVTTVYKSSGTPAVYSSHQEISLELFKGWS